MSKQIVLLAGRAGAGKDTVAEEIRRAVPGTATLAQADPMKRFVARVLGFPDEALWGPSELRETATTVTPLSKIDARYCLDDLVHELRTLTDAHVHHPEIYPLFFRWYLPLHDQGLADGRLVPRTVLQTFGTEFGRAVLGADVWSRAALGVARRLLLGGVTYSPRDGLRLSDDAPPAPCVVVSDVRFVNEVLNGRAAGALTVLVERPTGPTTTHAGHVSETTLGTIPRGFFDVALVNDGTLEQLRTIVHSVVDTYLTAYDYEASLFEGYPA